MTPSETNRDSNQPSSPFEDALETLIVSAFAKDETVEGEWKIGTPLAATPNWVVTVRKVYSDDEPTYDPELID